MRPPAGSEKYGKSPGKTIIGIEGGALECDFGASASAAGGLADAPADNRLRLIEDAWPTLPTVVKGRIVGLVETARHR
jgi:hypothetical protein